MKFSSAKKLTALILALATVFTFSSTGFAGFQTESDYSKSFSQDYENPDYFGDPDNSETPQQPGTPQEPETPPESETPADTEDKDDSENKTVAKLYVCSSMSIPVLVGHTYLYVQNLSDEPIQVGHYEVPVGQGVSIGDFSFSVSDGWGIYYNLEAYRENRDDCSYRIWSKSKNLDRSDLEKLTKNLKNYLNHWDPFFNCAFFAFSIWNSTTGDFIVPLVIPIFSHLALIIGGGKKGVLEMYEPDKEQVLRQKGYGSSAKLEPVGSSTINA